MHQTPERYQGCRFHSLLQFPILHQHSDYGVNCFLSAHACPHFLYKVVFVLPHRYLKAQVLLSRLLPFEGISTILYLVRFTRKPHWYQENAVSQFPASIQILDLHSPVNSFCNCLSCGVSSAFTAYQIEVINIQP